MASELPCDTDLSLVEIWKNYLDVWVDPPHRVISWLNLLRTIDVNSDVEKVYQVSNEQEIQSSDAHKTVEKHDVNPKVLLFRPRNHRIELEDRFEKEHYSSSHEPMSRLSIQCN